MVSSDGRGRPVLLVPGAMHTARHWLSTPDGRPGWAPLLTAAGFRVLPTQLPRRPLTGAQVVDLLATAAAGAGGPVDVVAHSMGATFAFDLAERHPAAVGRIVAVAPGPPSRAPREPAVVEDLGPAVRIRTPQGMDRTVPRAAWLPPTRAFVLAKLLAGSTRFPRAHLDAYLASLVPAWSGLLVERFTGDPTPPDPASWAGRRVLVVTGSHDRDHPAAVDRRLAAHLTGLGAAVTVDRLGERGVVGNGHMLMLEDGSDRLLADLVAWLVD